MIKLSLNGGSRSALQVLCLGCHSDDIEIGCGGAILQLAKQYPECEFHWVIFSAIGVRETEAQRSAALFADSINLHGPILKSFPDGFMPYVGDEVKTVFEDLKRRLAPDLIFTTSRSDAHQDHRLIAELTWNTFRDHFILEYEVPKYDGDLGQPNLFVPLEPDTYERKISNLMEAFQSQHVKRWFDRSTFLSLMRLRGMECNAASGYAEAFYCRKVMM